jgi:cytochrome o ubiquinol oxidase subunit 1
MLIPGALFGYLCGYMFWFPKAFGFRLDERWGKRAFWAWIVGFYLAFMPLYALGLMGMPRRLERYATAAWQPWLMVAELGALVVLLGIVFLGVQLYVSIRDRDSLRDVTGDPWDGRTLEWATASPPAHYNFARVPEVHGRDELARRKEHGARRPQTEKWEGIVMPRDTGAGAIIGVLSFLFGFAMVWHIWWLALAGLVGMVAVVVARSFDDNDLRVIPAEEVEATERQREVRYV